MKLTLLIPGKNDAKAYELEVHVDEDGGDHEVSIRQASMNRRRVRLEVLEQAVATARRFADDQLQAPIVNEPVPIEPD